MWHTVKEMAQTARLAVKLGRQGRLVIPARLRNVLGLSRGDALVAHVEDGERLVIEKRRAALARLQARFSRFPSGVSLADELIAERRAEAKRERSR